MCWVLRRSRLPAVPASSTGTSLRLVRNNCVNLNRYDHEEDFIHRGGLYVRRSMYAAERGRRDRFPRGLAQVAYFRGRGYDSAGDYRDRHRRGWEYAVPSSADWITVDDGTAGKLLVSVTKNPTAEKRTASIRITAKDNDDLEPVSVTVTQAGSETPEVYSLTVDPAALTFAAEGAAGQSVKSDRFGRGITWSAAVETPPKSG